MPNANGMNWITQNRRLAIYLRDGLACCYCGESVENGITLTLDHVLPRSKGGDNSTGNLVTACHRCNSVRGDRSLKTFAADVATYVAVKPSEVLKQVSRCLARPIDLATARMMVARRGSCAKVIARRAAGKRI